jgi:Ser/Thr protein kinase RdoA (MazF antagonist)
VRFVTRVFLDSALKQRDSFPIGTRLTFEAETPAAPSILKVTHSSHRTYDQLEAEAEWLRYLASKDVRTPRTYPSINSLDVEQVPAGDGYFSVAKKVVQRARDLPLSDFQYGLIHADVYQDNFFWSNGELLLFDFDNCEYGYYISDIAIAIYAALWRLPDRADRAEFSERFLRSLLTGYREEHVLSRKEIEALPLFLQLREVLIYIVAKKMLDLNNLTPMQARLLAERGNRIRQNRPIVDLTTVLGSL